MKTNNDIIASLDIGTTKIVCVICRLVDSGRLNIHGIGIIPSEGLQKGVVANIDKTAQAIRKAVEAAERMAGVAVKEVWVSISGEHVRSVGNTGMVAIKHGNNEITDDDVSGALKAARSLSITRDSEILHVIPQEFIVDSQGGIEQPVGMHGKRLEARVLICTGAVKSVQSIEKSVKKAGLKKADIVLDHLASCYAVLDKSERNLGAALIDIGGSTTNIAVYLENSIRYVAAVEIGGNDITRDIARTLQVPLKTAEEMKIRYGSSGASVAGHDKSAGVKTGTGAKEVSRGKITAIVDPRIKEIVLSAKEKIKLSGCYENLVSGIILTGGGVLLDGIGDCAEKIFKMQVRIGIPSGCGGLAEVVQSPALATAVGLCMYAAEHGNHGKKTSGRGTKEKYGKILDTMKLWFKDIF